MRKLSIVFFILGIGLLSYLIYDSNPGELWAQLRSIGPSFGFVLGVGLASMFFLACAWKDLLYPERATASVWDLFLAGLVGFTVNELTPGSVAGEPVKGAMLRGKIPGEDIVSSLILHNYLYLITNFLQIALGAAFALALLELSPVLWWGCVGVVIVVPLIVLLLALAVRWGMAERFMRVLRVLRLPIKNISEHIVSARKADAQARGYHRERPGAFWRAFGWIFMARAMAVVEIWVILTLIDHPAAFGTLMLLQTSSLLVYVVFFFVPSQMGANELGSTVIFDLLRFNPATGLLMELVRRLRKISIVIIGLSILAVRGLVRPRTVAPDVSTTVEAAEEASRLATEEASRLAAEPGRPPE